MKKFIFEIVIFIFLGIGLFFVIYKTIDFYLNKYNNYTDNDVYIWGDSQVYRGIDIVLLNKISKKNIYSSAHLGAGIYDFLIFTESIPNGATTIIGFPKSAFVRPKKHDWNRLGLSFLSLKLLKENGYTHGEIFNIIKLNLIPHKKFNNLNKMYIDTNTIAIEYEEAVSSIDTNSIDVLEYLANKQLLYLEGINNLVKKKCKIIIVDLPYHPYLENYLRSSITYEIIFHFRNELLSNLNIDKQDSIKLGTEQLLMHDFTHLTELGAKVVTQRTNEYLTNVNKTKFISFYLTK